MSRVVYLLRSFAALALVSCAVAATAGPIVTVNGRGWLQPSDIFFDYDTIRQTCSTITGACSGLLGDIDLSGYTWADVDDVNGLLNYYLGGSLLGPGPDRFTIDSFPGPDRAWAAFFGDFEPQELTHGFTGLGGSVRDFSVTASVQINCGTAGGLNCRNSMFTDSPHQVIGGWFFKDEAPPIDTPIPATMLLVGLGLAALGYARR
jgi:hypothetical protein